jgi:hypothetical protein
VESFGVSCGKIEGCRLSILVEAMGHKNFGRDQREDRKGLVYFEQIGQNASFTWNIYAIPVYENPQGNWSA